VDINRNTDWEFNGPGSSAKPGHEEYNGGTVWSEVETRCVAVVLQWCHIIITITISITITVSITFWMGRYVRDLVLNNDYLAYLSLHSGEQQVTRLPLFSNTPTVSL
jgi:hypothetical protein